METSKDIQEAEGHLKEASAEVNQAVKDLERAEQNLERAQAELEEAEHHRVIHFWLDGEPEETSQEVWTPNAIIQQFGKKDPATHYLVQLKGDETITYKDKGAEPIKLHEGEKFQIISTGPTPVSDGSTRLGAPGFIDGLRALGYNPSTVPDKPDHVMIDYMVETGQFAGKRVRLGFIVPADFPITPPSGPHVSPHIHPIKAGGDHPLGGIGDSPSFSQAPGDAWQYWSRPFTNWGATKKTVAVYMNHIFQLWHTQ